MLNGVLYILNMLLLFALFLSYASPYISPDTFLWPIALLGLIYPFLLLTNVLFTIYWLIRFKKHFWANIIVILLGYGHIQNLINIQDNGIDTEAEFSVLSFNVRLFNAYNWIKKDNVKQEIIQYLNKESVSILCLQEFYAPEELPKLNYPHSHIGLQSKRKSWRMATYSNFPIFKKGTVSISGERTNNVCIYSDIAIGGDSIRVYNVHLASNWFEKEDYEFLDRPSVEGAESIIQRLKTSFFKRAKQVKAIKAHMNTSPYPIILCGDFNDTPTSFTYNQLSEGLNDSFTNTGMGLGQTYNGKFPTLRIDYILYSPEFELNSFKTTEVNLSDHFPIVSTFN